MKILMISMFSNHFFRWTEQLKKSNYEIYWVDVFDSNTKVKKIDFVNQIIGWRNKVKYPGKYFIKQNLPGVHNLIIKINQRDLSTTVEKIINEINPDVVHSFIMQSATTPLIETMRKFPEIKWVYSAWGNDLYYRQQNKQDLEKIKKTLPEIDYMFADCLRDFYVAKEFGFKGTYLGTFPTGGGYEFDIYDPYITPIEERTTILIKGYQGKLGRCNSVLRSIIPLRNDLKKYNIIVFGATKEVSDFVKKTELNHWSNFKMLLNISHLEVLKLMGLAKIYIGNNISDGLPNTLLEAIIMGAFPIQSNPGGASEEIINEGVNGFLISNPEDSEEIKMQIIKAVNLQQELISAVNYNLENIKPKLERERVKNDVIKKYQLIENRL
ncbi:glycosyltransferase [Salegentibacter sp. JZCK2]|uniref:glycosyltransferase n=1 Tax=Salegentibacter tibetensis TaxID=2873600 RepID=UPI001CCCDB81|nr:glycosyltransferase [Salegentibacter tibetensis]MBZ9729752.1 glycosyltransferase [Salegentibacter tibetensis]